MKNIIAAMVLVMGTGAVAAQDDGPVPVEHFALRASMQQVSLSPDGQMMAYLTLNSRDGDYIIEVRRLDDLSAEPRRLGSERAMIEGIRWVSNDHLWVNFRQRTNEFIQGVNQGVWSSLDAIVDVTGDSEWRELPSQTSFVGLLPDEPNHILVRSPNIRGVDLSVANIDDLEGVSLGEVRNPSFYRMDVRNTRMRRVLRDNARIDGYRFDREGNPRLASELDVATREQILYYRDAGEGTDWEEMYRVDIDDDYDQFQILGIDPADDRALLISSYQGEDTQGVYTFNIDDGEIGELLFRHPSVDLAGTVRTQAPGREGEIIGLSYVEEGVMQYAYLDGGEGALHEQLRGLFPGREVSITSRAGEAGPMVIYTVGPRDPGTYYLLAGGQIQRLGSRNLLLEGDDLADVEFVRWEARDGRSIPGYLTIPNQGEAPYPLVVLPHGGPWVSEHINYDEWGQLLASRGYLVLQPGYRGTQGYGIDHWRSSFAQWGYTMQDDKDDGVAHLVAEGMVDPDQVAMFGWSYGGYAATVAAQRNPNIYQCAITGAPVTDINRVRANFARGRLSRERIREGYDGVNTAVNTDEVNIPILVIHGSVDQRVPIVHADDYVAGLERNGKEHRYIVLDGADHFSNTLTYDHKLTLYTELLGWLANNCGMSTPANPAP